MKHLIIYAHPNADSLNGQLRDTVVKALKANQQEIIVRDLYALDFDPVLSLADMQGQLQGKVAEDVQQEQNYISWADRIVFIYPIWWTGLPAILKGYIDRVFSYGFAYRYDKGKQMGLLKGKEAVIINTQGKSHQEYSKIGMDKALSLTSDTGIFTYCGFHIEQHYFFDRADRADEAQVNIWMEQLEQDFSSLLKKSSCFA